MTTTVRSVLGRFFRVAVDPQTYRNLAYLLLTFPLGILYFTVLWGGGAAGVSTIPVLVGIPILVAVLALAGYLADLESRLARGLLGAEVTYETPQPTEETLGEYLKRLALSPRSYLAVVYLLSKFVVGLASFIGLTFASVLSSVLVLAPVLYNRPGVSYQFGVTTIETLPAALGASVAGVLLAFVSLHLFNVAAWALGEYTEIMLGHGE
jgi:hypothetical protein